MAGQLGELLFENAKIIFRNFAGREDRFNPPGARNFGLVLPPDLARDMAADGWNVKFPKVIDEDRPKDPFVQVAVGFKGIRKPIIVMISSRGRTNLSEDLCELIDYADIENVDLIIRPREWEPGRIKAYLKSIYVTIHEDRFQLKYADIPEIGTGQLAIAGPQPYQTWDYEGEEVPDEPRRAIGR